MNSQIGEAFVACALMFATLAPGVGTSVATPGRPSDAGTADQGWLHCGPHGAGHFVKMVHNGIEYGLMAAYAEGFNILKHANAGLIARDSDAETAPQSEPQYVARAALARNWMETETGRVPLGPGMSATVEIHTGKRRIISYLLSPLARKVQEGMHER